MLFLILAFAFSRLAVVCFSSRVWTFSLYSDALIEAAPSVEGDYIRVPKITSEPE